ncbi:hypothetical protein [Micromonospora fulviviridis]|uniref:Uncharacterized protein n=1 Tax=Micromonospora fulviviridis TaxID=47860 RepID=A0ABV2VSP9_9ACTN
MAGQSFRRERRRAAAAIALLLLAYFVVPVEPDPNGLRLALRASIVVKQMTRRPRPNRR